VPFRTKRVKEPREPEDGTRVLVMRLWPRGVKKTHVDAWERDLGPPVELMRGFLDGKVPWADYKREYSKNVKKAGKEKLSELRSRAKKGETITLLCWCPDESRCHRSLLRAILEKP
jgi:uncharacterized protein YeaO (DUF488 family)